MPVQSDAPLLSKKYLYALPVAVVLIGWNLLFNPDARKWVGLKQGKTFSSLFNIFKRHGSPAAASSAKAANFSAEAFDAFKDGLTRRELPKGLEIVTNTVEEAPPPPPPPPAETPEQKRLREEAEAKAKVKREEAKLAYLWQVRVQGTYQDLQGRWTAIVAGHNMYANDRLVTGSEERCAYNLLSIGQKCGWLRVVPPKVPEAELAKLPEGVVWPDVSLIELERVGLFRGTIVPARVRLGNGTTLGKGDALTYKSKGTTFRVKQLWMNGVVFEVTNSNASAEVACVLVTP